MSHDFLSQLQDSLEIPLEQNGSPNQAFSHVVFVGMGGSAVAAHYTQALVAAQLPCSFQLCQTAELPAYIQSNTLVIGCSYSGTTQETKALLKQAEKRGACIALISTQPEQLDIPTTWLACRPPQGLQPRQALLYHWIFTLRMLEAANLYAIPQQDWQAASERLVEHSSDLKTAAEQLLDFFNGKIIGVFSHYLALGLRAKQQFNENSKHFAFWNVFPEMMHNEITAFEQPNEHVALLLLQTHIGRTSKAINFCAAYLKNNGISHKILTLPTQNAIEDLLFYTYCLDHCSWLLALHKGVDPHQIQAIQDFKEFSKK